VYAEYIGVLLELDMLKSFKIFEKKARKLSNGIGC
jgi:hypothetical protein